MARILTILILALVLPLGAAAQTQAHCDAVITLSQMQSALERVAAPGHRRVAADMDLLGRTLLRIDAHSLAYAVQDHALSNQLPTLLAFLDIAQASETAYLRGDIEPLRRVLAMPEITAVTLQAGRILQRYPCREEQDAGLHRLQQLDAEGLSQLNSYAFSRTQAVGTLGASLLLGLLSALLIRRQVRNMALKRRRQKRHYVELDAILVEGTDPANIAKTALWTTVEIADISCEGIKISHSQDIDPLEMGTITLLIEGSQHPADVKWSNKHYSGCKFHQRLDHKQVMAWVAQFPPVGDITKAVPTTAPAAA